MCLSPSPFLSVGRGELPWPGPGISGDVQRWVPVSALPSTCTLLGHKQAWQAASTGAKASAGPDGEELQTCRGGGH